jgi:hypothetical protein
LHPLDFALGKEVAGFRCKIKFFVLISRQLILDTQDAGVVYMLKDKLNKIWVSISVFSISLLLASYGIKR